MLFAGFAFLAGIGLLSGPMATLIVIPSDKISDWIHKGEVTDRYYNPGDRFDEIHLFLLHAETPDHRALKQMAGKANIHVHCFPTGIAHFAKTLGWNPALLRRWCRPMVKLAGNIRPDLIRCHGASINAFAAREIKLRLGTPYVISMHINPDEDIRSRKMGALRRVRDTALRRFETSVLHSANRVLPVYRPIVPYLERRGVTHFEVAYNFLNNSCIRQKRNYQLHSPIRLISVGRQFKEKNPDNVIRALVNIPEAVLTLVGDGAYHEQLNRVAHGAGVSDRVVFKKVVSNDDLCSMLADFDIFVTHSEYWEISKSVLEPLLTGLPVILNRRQGHPVPELTDEICLLVENTPKAYEAAIQRLIGDDGARARLGERAFQIAQEAWSPRVTEQRYASIYDRVLSRA